MNITAVLASLIPLSSIIPWSLDELVEAFQDQMDGFILEIIQPILQSFNEAVEWLVLLVITPQLPPGADEFVDSTGNSPIIGQAVWAAPVEMNNVFTDLAIGLFSIALLIYIIASGLGFVRGGFSDNMFKVALAFIILIANQEILNLFYALIYAISFYIINSSEIIAASGTGGITGILGSVFAGIVVFSVTSAGTGLVIGLIFLLIFLFLIITIFGIHIIGMVGYGIFPLLIVTWILGEVTDIASQWHDKMVGFFIPAMYAPILFAIVFKFAAFFFQTAFGYGEGSTVTDLDDVDEGAFSSITPDSGALAQMEVVGGNFIEGVVGPFLFIFFLILGLWIVIKNMQAGGAVMSAIKTGATLAVGGAVAAVAGGGAAATMGKGAAKGAMFGNGGVRNMVAGGVNETMRSGSVDTNIGDSLGSMGDKFQELNEDTMLEKSVDTGRSAAKRVTPGVIDADEYEEKFDEMHTGGENAHGEVDRSDTAGQEKWQEELDRQTEAIGQGEIGGDEQPTTAAVKDRLSEIGGVLGQQKGWDSATTENKQEELVQEFQNAKNRLELERRQGNIEATDDELDAMAFENTLNTDSDLDSREKATMSLTRMEDGEMVGVAGDPYSDKLRLQQMDEDARHEYIRNQDTAGFTRPTANAATASSVLLGGVEEGNTKSERLGASATPNMSGRTGTDVDIKSASLDNDEVVFSADATNGELDALTNMDRVDSLEFDRKSGTYSMSLEDFDKAMNDVDFQKVDATADRGAMIAVEKANRQRMEGKEEEMKAKIKELEPDNFDESLTQRIELREQKDEEVRNAIESVDMNEVPERETYSGNFESSWNTNWNRQTVNDQTDLRMTSDGDVVDIEGEYISGGSPNTPGKVRLNNGEEVELHNEQALKEQLPDHIKENVNSVSGWNVRVEGAQVKDTNPTEPDKGKKVVQVNRAGKSGGTRVTPAQDVVLKPADEKLQKGVSGMTEVEMKNIKNQLNRSDIAPGADHSAVDQMSNVVHNRGKDELEQTVKQAKGVTDTQAKQIATTIENMSI